MSTCPSCGKRVGKTAAFCAHCGTPLTGGAPTPVAAAPAAAAPEPAATTSLAPLQRWVGTDWPLALLCVGLWLAIAAGAGAVIGLVATAIANGPNPDALLGLVAGAWVPFAGLGSDVVVLAGNDEAVVTWFSSGLAPATTVGLAVVARTLFRTALPRVGVDRDFTLAFVAKVAVLGAIAVALLGSIGSVGDPSDGLGEGFQLVSRSTSAEPALWAFALLALVGLTCARQRLGRPAWTDRMAFVRPLRAGAAAWLVAVLVLGVGTTIGGVVGSDDATEGFAGAIVSPVVLGNTGVAAQAFAVGASVETVESSEQIAPFDREVDAHLSLFHFDLPPVEDSDAAPIWLWALLAVTPLVAFWATRRWLARTTPGDGSSVLLQVVGVAGGFALGAWFGGVVAPFYAGVGAVDGSDVLGRAAIGRPAVAATVGLTLLWAFVGALPAAIRYARSNGIDLIASSSSGPAPEAAPEAASPADADAPA